MWFKKKKDKKDLPRRKLINPDYAPNKAEIAHFVRKFYKRRIRQRWLALLFLALPSGAVWGLFEFRTDLFHEGNWRDPSLITLVLLGMLVAAEVAVVAISLFNWRCPHCENLAPLRPHPYTCTHCSAPLRFTPPSD